jgi:hypothetical protein
MEFYSATKKKEFCHLQVNGQNWRTLSKVMLARLRRPKTSCSLSYVEYRPNKNAAIL